MGKKEQWQRGQQRCPHLHPRHVAIVASIGQRPVLNFTARHVIGALWGRHGVLVGCDDCVGWFRAVCHVGTRLGGCQWL